MMSNLSSVARILFVIAMAAFGMQHFIHAKMGAGVGPPWVSGGPLWMCFMGTFFLLVSASIASGRETFRTAALFGVGLFLYMVVFYAPRLAARIRDPAPWTSGFEVLAISGAALVLARSMQPEQRTLLSPAGISRPLGILGRFLFAIPLIVFGTQHFLYAGFVATLVPAWIPAHLFWAYFVGVAFYAAAISIATTIQGRLGAGLLGVMFFLWVLIVHLPRVVAALHNQNEWTSLFVALAMCAAAWIVAGTGHRSEATLN
jgi:hypothetical protein